MFIVVLSMYNIIKYDYIIITERNDMDNKPLIIKKRGEDGNTLVTVRMRNDIVERLDKLSAETNRSRNELINTILDHGLKNIVVEE